VAPDRSSPPASPRAERATIYFLVDDGRAPLGVRRTVELTEPPQGSRVRAAVAALFAGPTPEESAEGLTTAIPAGTHLRSLTFRDQGASAIVDLTDLPADAGPVSRVRVITQVARTVIGVSDVHRVWLRSQGEPWDLPRHDGSVVDRAIDYGVLVGWDVCEAKPGTEDVPGECFTAVP
jgi:spore germination protein GerM